MSSFSSPSPVPPLELFYIFASEDARQVHRLEKHLAGLEREGLITPWQKLKLLPGSLWESEARARLESARVILLLVSPDFINSDYCYSVEMARALERDAANQATVIPVILKAVDWTSAPFAKLAVLPTDGRPIIGRTTPDVAFADVAKGIRRVINQLNGLPPDTNLYTGSKQRQRGDQSMQAETNIVSTPGALTPQLLRKAAERYQKDLKLYEGKANYELALRSAFQTLLAEQARRVNWTLIPELTIKGGIRPDGVLIDPFKTRRGYWEAKGPKSNLDAEITKKIAAGYPLINTVFENTERAVLYQNKRRVPVEFDLRNSNDVSDLLHQFLTYAEPEIAGFEEAVKEFKGRIPDLANALLEIIEKQYLQNRNFITAFNSFMELCQTSLNPQISPAEIKEMLVQHLLTERLFRTVFNNSDFVSRNVIAVEIEKVIRALASHAFNRQEFLKSLDRFYVAIEAAAKGQDDWSERQHFLNTVYERFFQGFSVRQADTLGIVYTPQEIVDFMVESVDEVLKREFGKSLATPGVKILDPATGTGNFIVNIIQRIQSRAALKEKYAHDLFANEISLLPYYIASLNIEHEYYEKMGQYESFEGICFVDTLELAEGQQPRLFVEENTERVEREKAADIMVVIANPPYNVGQKNESDNNKNRKYPFIDQRIKETYVRDSQATLRTQLYDAYVRFFRWATDRLQGRDGIICFVSNNSFVDQITFDGMRKHLLRDFSHVYHLDLHGNIRKNPKLSGTAHNVFGIQIGVGITIAVKLAKSSEHNLFYHRAPEFWRKSEKLNFLIEKKNIYSVEWQNPLPDDRFNWITEGLKKDFLTYPLLGGKEAKMTKNVEFEVLFKTYSTGINSGRDSTVYNFNYSSLVTQVTNFADEYNGEISRWLRNGAPKDIDNFVNYSKLKWSRNLKRHFHQKRHIQFDSLNIKEALYRPFTKMWLYFSEVVIDEKGSYDSYFPLKDIENIVLCVPGLGNRREFGCLVTNTIPSMDLAFEKVQCFPFFTYAPDGSDRRENITDWALAQFRERYGPDVSKWQIFDYVYGMLHHPQYRARYAENLKRDLPHIPLLLRPEAFLAASSIGKHLKGIHMNYEQVPEYPLEEHDNGSLPYELSRRVEKMRLAPDKTALVVNKSITLANIPPECFQYRLGNRSALEWVIDQYQVSTDARSGITSDPNRLDDPGYIISLVKRVVNVSLKTVELVNELSAAVTLADWLEPQEDEPVGEA